MSVAVLNRANHVVSTPSIKAYGKINLTLEVLGPRPDGYHEIRSLVIGVDLSDRVACRLVTESGVRITCADASLACENNLACRAAQEFLHYTGISGGVEIELEKGIPVGGGMGGGSSDAATVLHLLNELSGVGLSRERLVDLGARLGSDVPLFFHLPGALVKGRGERVTSQPIAWRGFVLLVLVDAFVSTPLIYGRWSPGDSNSVGRCRDLSPACRLRSADELNRCLFNDLERAVCQESPPVRDACRKLESLGVAPFRISGAGSTLFRLFDEEADARRVARFIESHVDHVRTRIVAAPVGGFHPRIEEN